MTTTAHATARKTIQARLTRLLSELLRLEQATRAAHWNTTGPHFLSFHEAMGAFQGQLAGTIDEIAEIARGLVPELGASPIPDDVATMTPLTPLLSPVDVAVGTRFMLQAIEELMAQLTHDLVEEGYAGAPEAEDAVVGVLRMLRVMQYKLESTVGGAGR